MYDELLYIILLFFFLKIRPAGSCTFRYLPNRNWLFVLVPLLLSTPQVLPFPVKEAQAGACPPRLPQKEILWASAARCSWGNSCVCYYPICMTILQLQVVPEDTNKNRVPQHIAFESKLSPFLHSGAAASPHSALTRADERDLIMSLHKQESIRASLVSAGDTN